MMDEHELGPQGDRAIEVSDGTNLAIPSIER
jgi:hypothetical protein